MRARNKLPKVPAAEVPPDPTYGKPGFEIAAEAHGITDAVFNPVKEAAKKRDEFPAAAEPLDIPDDDAVPEHQMTHIERINGPRRAGPLAILAFAAGLLLPALGWAQPPPGAVQPQAQQSPPLTITEAMLGRCTVDSAAMREQAQKLLADARGEAAAKEAYWAAYVKGSAPEGTTPR